MTAPDLVYFGDSLTDDGNLFEATDGVLPNFVRNALGGETNSISDGIVHSEYTSSLTGQTVENYAVAAAQADGEYRLGDLLDASGIGALITVPPDAPRLCLLYPPDAADAMPSVAPGRALALKRQQT